MAESKLIRGGHRPCLSERSEAAVLRAPRPQCPPSPPRPGAQIFAPIHPSPGSFSPTTSSIRDPTPSNAGLGSGGWEVVCGPAVRQVSGPRCAPRESRPGRGPARPAALLSPAPPERLQLALLRAPLTSQFETQQHSLRLCQLERGDKAHGPPGFAGALPCLRASPVLSAAARGDRPCSSGSTWDLKDLT